jgi:hypothetical protein
MWLYYALFIGKYPLGTSINLISGAISVVRSLLANLFLATHSHKWY